MMNLANALEAALNHHRAGQLGEAERIYREILAVEPRHAETLHLLGVLAHQAGHLQPAVDLIREAIQWNPRAGHFHNNLGNALRAQGRTEEARGAYEEALRLDPQSAEAHSNLGNVLRDAGRLEDAVSAYREALVYAPGDADVHSNLGTLLRELGRPAEAAAACREAVALDPAHAAAHNNLGNALKDLRRLDDALAEYRRAIELQPDFLDACLNHAGALAIKREFTAAEAGYRWALGIQPASATAYEGLGHTLREAGDLTGALATGRRAIELDPAAARAHLNLAVTLSEAGDEPAAFASAQRAFELAPAQPEMRLAYAHVLLLRGDFTGGLPLYEARWEAAGFNAQHIRGVRPRWTGQRLTGERVLIRAEQGFGDSIQFVRYASVIAARGGVAMLECQPALVELLRSVPDLSDVVPTGAPLTEAEFEVPMLSLPLACSTTLETIPAGVPYLTADPARRAVWRERLARHGGRLRVGLAWMGSPANLGNPMRSISLENLGPLFDLEEVLFISLQKGIGSEQTCSLSPTARLIDWTAELRDFSDTAALIAELDLVISVDTAVLHPGRCAGQAGLGAPPLRRRLALPPAAVG